MFLSCGFNDKADSFCQIVNYCFELAFPCNKKARVPSKNVLSKVKLDLSVIWLREKLIEMYFLTTESHTLSKKINLGNKLCRQRIDRFLIIDAVMLI